MKINLLFTMILYCSFSLRAQDFFDINAVQDIRIVFSRNDWDFMLDSMAQAGDDYSRAYSVTINGQTFLNVGVKYKGNSSYNPNNRKNPFAIKLDQFINQDYQGYTSFKLNNAFKDPSFVREVLGYEIARNYLPTVKANYANVFVNGSLHGVYSNVQDLNKYFLGNHFADNDGSFFKCDPIIGTQPGAGCNPGGSTLEFLGQDTACYYNRYENQNIYGWTELKNLTDTLNNLPSNVSKILDVDRALWMLAFNNVFCNFDSYTGSGHNYYVYRDLNQQFSTLLWDLNEVFGVFLNGGQGNLTFNQLVTLSPLHNSNMMGRPLLFRLLANPRYKRSYIAHLKTILDENVSNDLYFTRGQQLQNLISTYLNNDPNKLFTYQQFQQNLNTAVGNICGLRALMEPRDSFLLQHQELTYLTPTISNIQIPSAPLPGNTVNITAQVFNASFVALRYRNANYKIFQEIQMFDDGQHNDGAAGDGIWGASFVMDSPQKQYYIYAENSNAARFSPARAEYEFYTLNAAFTSVNSGDVVVNELMAQNNTGATDEMGVHEDWIEFYNNTISDIDLGGYFLTDDTTNLIKWQFPVNTIIPAGDYLIVWADNDAANGPLHATFKLSAAGESVTLSDPAMNRIDQVFFGQQTADMGYARIPNGTGNFVIQAPTFSANNQNTAVSQNLLSENDVKVFPNPSKGILNVQISELIENELLSIYDQYGRLIFIDNADFQNIIDLEDFSSGIYFLKYGNVNKKIIKI